uniref:cDNA FLJ61746 n=1 Tax=Homo sapiens TaxID=9606 RepID=B7Z875_HUMAN|nr:unnamed protein product [Homo sapiens]
MQFSKLQEILRSLLISPIFSSPVLQEPPGYCQKRYWKFCLQTKASPARGSNENTQGVLEHGSGASRRESVAATCGTNTGSDRTRPDRSESDWPGFQLPRSKASGWAHLETGRIPATQPGMFPWGSSMGTRC